MHKNKMFLFLTISLSGLLLPGCGIENIFKPREVRTAWLPVRRLPTEQATLSQVKNLSRDLEWCLERTGQPSFSDENFLKLVNQGDRVSELETEIYSTTSCNKTLLFLMETINSALESGNSQEEVYEALLKGSSEVISEHDNAYP